MRLSGYETYGLYSALKLHFSVDKYNFFTYNGKIKNISKEHFRTRKDRFQFEKLARKCADVQTHIVVNLFNDKTWIGEMLDDDAFERTNQFVKNAQSMSYVFKNDLEKIGNVKESLRTKDNQYPDIVTLLMSNEITIHTFIILNDLIQFIPKFDAKFANDFVWTKLGFKIKRLAPFLLPQIDIKKFGGILKEHIYA